MNKYQKIAILFEVLICFYPAIYLVVGGTIVFFALLGGSSFGSITPVAFFFLFFGYLGLVGVIALLIKVLSPQTKTLSPLAIKINIGIGALIYSFFPLGRLFFYSGELSLYYTFIYILKELLPVFCSIHLLWLGRDYVFKSSG